MGLVYSKEVILLPFDWLFIDELPVVVFEEELFDDEEEFDEFPPISKSDL